MKRLLLIGCFCLMGWISLANHILIPMDNTQSNHLKAYGVVYHTLKKGLEVQWLLNYRGGSFILPFDADGRTECLLKGVGFEVIPPARLNAILAEIASPEVNADAVKLEKAPKIAVYSPKEKKPWDDAVTLALTYAEIPYDVVYDSEILDGCLKEYDWLHLHHEDFTGQMGKFYRNYRHMDWYKAEETTNKQTARKYGFSKISELKKAVVRTIRDYVSAGGFMFAMCSATDTFDIALAAMEVDICDVMFDGDPVEPGAQEKPMDGDISFEHVSFRYETGPDVLSDVSFTIPAGTSFGILGGTGSGKSSLLLMLCRLYEPSGGRVTVGGADIADMPARWVRDHVGIVLQEPFLFSRSIEENIGICGASAEAVRRAAVTACIHNDIEQFSQGYETMVGERGVTLSGGQKQRVAIARMLTKKTPVIVFDDSLSAVDTQTDEKIRSALGRDLGGATSIIISHRITTLMDCDNILVLDHGKVVQLGTPQELLRQKGIFRQIYDMQMSIGEEETA